MKHPYEDAPDYRRWRMGVAQAPASELDPLVSAPFSIGPTDPVVTAGSCFAQHISRHLRQRGFRFLEAEPAHPLLSAQTAATYGYGLYSARYGNIYTARQLLQLLRRAQGRFTPVVDVWEQQGRFFDPFRPAIQPHGFASRTEYEIDRRQHFAAVLRAFEQLDYLVFTLGLTECWLSREDGAVYPACPGTVAGEFDPARHAYKNFGVDEVVEDMTTFIHELRQINPRAKLILSVSPVPLAATAENRHVLVSTSYSKSVLRVAAELLSKLPGVGYFPAYEIITGSFSRGRYFSSDLRSVTEEGVCHVMNVFFRHMSVAGADKQQQAVAESSAEDFLPRMKKVIDTICEESKLDDGIERN